MRRQNKKWGGVRETFFHVKAPLILTKTDRRDPRKINDGAVAERVPSGAEAAAGAGIGHP